MKAIYIDKFGGVVQYGDRPTPKPAPGQVLIEVHAAAVNARDWQMREGHYTFRRLSGRPPIVLGSDVSGVVVHCGKKVEHLRVGDEVFAMQTTFGGMGAFAEYMAVNADVVARKPASVSYIDAAAVPVAGMTAWQGLYEMAKIQAGTKVVVVGASGGVGHYAIQFARHTGAIVTGVCSAANAELVRGLGADRVVDYKSEKFADVLRDQNVVFDTVGSSSLADCAAALAGSGSYLTTNPKPREALDWATTAVTGVFGARRSRLVLVTPKAAQLAAIAELIDAGHVRSVVENIYPLSDAAAALGKSRSGRTRGKLVLQVR